MMEGREVEKQKHTCEVCGRDATDSGFLIGWHYACDNVECAMALVERHVKRNPTCPTAATTATPD